MSYKENRPDKKNIKKIKSEIRELDENVILQSLLLPREMFQNSRAQLFVSLAMLFLLGIQLYLFISIHSILNGLQETMNTL